MFRDVRVAVWWFGVDSMYLCGLCPSGMTEAKEQLELLLYVCRLPLLAVSQSEITRHRLTCQLFSELPATHCK